MHISGATDAENIMLQKNMLNYVLEVTETDKLRVAGSSAENIIALYVLSVSKKNIFFWYHIWNGGKRFQRRVVCRSHILSHLLRLFYFVHQQSRVDLIKIAKQSIALLISTVSFKDLESGEWAKRDGESTRVSWWDPRNRQEFRKK